MAQSQIQQYSLEDLRNALSSGGVNTALIGQQARQGAELSSTLQSKQLEQEQEAQKIQQEIASLKADRDKKAATQAFISGLPPEEQQLASLDPMTAIKSKLEVPSFDTVNTAEGVFRIPKKGGKAERIGSPVPLVVAGQKAEAVKTAETEKVTKAAETALSKAKAGLSILDEAIKKVNPLTAGAGSYTAGVPVLGQLTGATNLQADIQTIKSRLGLDALLEAKAQSKAGASGFGQLSDKEMQILQSQVANLDQAQTQEQLKQRLEEIKLHYNNVIAMYEGRNPFGANNPAPTLEGGLAPDKQKRLEELRAKKATGTLR